MKTTNKHIELEDYCPVGKTIKSCFNETGVEIDYLID